DGKGMWPAFWLLPADETWPPEIDVLEAVSDPTHIYMSTHSARQPTVGVEANVTPDAFHTYAVAWDASQIIFYIDGKQIGAQKTPADFHKPMYVLANLAIGGNWPGNPHHRLYPRLPVWPMSTHSQLLSPAGEPHFSLEGLRFEEAAPAKTRGEEVPPLIDMDGANIFVMTMSLLFVSQMATYSAILFTLSVVAYALRHRGSLRQILRIQGFFLLFPGYAIL